MKNLLKLGTVAGLLLLWGGPAVHSQQADRVVKFSAPFAFQVENDRLPAGEYTVLVHGGWIQIQGKKVDVNVLTMPVSQKNSQEVETASVVFHQYKGYFFLAQIWAPGQSAGREVLTSPAEKQLAKQVEMVAVKLPVNTGGGGH
jgi:hypothetical protein